MTAELVIRWSGGELDLMGWNTLGAGDFLIETLADGTDWGNPEPVRRALRSAIADGSRSVKDRDDDRTIPLSLRVTAPDGVALAQGEQALDLIDGRRCELVWTPPDAFSSASVFVVNFADLRHKMDDLAETRTPPQRFYSLTLDCLPHVVADEYLTLEAQPATETVLDNTLNGDELVWSGDTVEINSVAPAGVEMTTAFPDFPGGSEPVEYVVESQLSDPNIQTQPYLYAIGKMVPTNLQEISGAGTELRFLGREPYGVDDNWIYFYSAPVGTSISRLRWTRTANSVAGFLLFSVQEIGQASAPTISAGHQSLRLLEVPGSRRASADLSVAARDTGSPSGGTPLGDVIVYTGPEYDPRITLNDSNGRTPDTAAPGTTMSGGYDSVTAAGREYYRDASLFPQGSYALWVRTRLESGGPSTIEMAVDVDLVHASDTSLKVADVDSKSTPTALSTSYALRTLGRVELPGMALSTDARYLLRFKVTATAPVRVDELLALNLTDGSLTIVETGTSTFRTLSSGAWTTRAGASRVDVEAASLDHDVRIRLVRGSQSDAQTASLSSQIRSWPGAHFLNPGRVHLYVATTEYAGAATTARFRPAGHTHSAS